MDALGIMFVPDSVLYLTGVALLLYIYGTWPHGKLKATGLPGPPLKPFVGSMLDMMSHKHAGEFYFNLKKKYGPLIRLLDMRLPVIAVFDLDIIKAILVKEHSSFTDRRSLPNRGIMTNSLLDRHGDMWKENRALITPFFTSGKLKYNIGNVKKCCDNMILNMKKACDNGRAIIETKNYTGCYAMDVICGTVFGLDVDSANDSNNPFIVNAKGISSVKLETLPTVIAMMFPFIGKIMNWCGVRLLPSRMVDFFARATLESIDLRLKSTHRRPDCIDAMIRAHEEEMDAETQKYLGGMSKMEVEKMKRKGLTRDEIIANGILMFLAGYDTTSTTLSFVLFALAHHQDWQEKCFDEISDIVGEGEIDYESVSKLKCMDMCIAEAQRILPIVYLFDRVATRDVTIKGLTIPEGTSCVIPVWALHHDPEFWPDPEIYDPLRFTAEAKAARNPYSFLPFGLGPRNCIGMRLALLEIKIGLVNILQNFQLLLDEKSSPFPPELSNTIHVTPKDGLLMRLVPR